MTATSLMYHTAGNMNIYLLRRLMPTEDCRGHFHNDKPYWPVFSVWSFYTSIVVRDVI
jgi:hypothetical protein